MAPQPRNIYNRALKEYWFKFTTPPSQHLEKVFLQAFEELVHPTSEFQKWLILPFPACRATATIPFLLSLNVLLVVSGLGHIITKYCQDKFLFGLQAIAQENKLGPISCCASREFIFGCTSENNTNLLLKHFTPETISHLARAGFPFKSSNAFLPNSQMEPQFGMYIDIL